MPIDPRLTLLALAALSGCSGAGTYYGASAYDDSSRVGYPYTSYYDWFATPNQRGPYYHNYPNIEYYTEYRPIYPY